MARLCGLVATGLLTSALLAPQAWGQDCNVPVELPDKPRIQDFADYNDFVVDVMKYKKQKRQQAQHKKKCPQAYIPRKRPNPDPRVVEGPETLGEALRRKERIPELDYTRHQTWYDRSTSRTFALPGLSPPEMSERSIEARLKYIAGADKYARESRQPDRVYDLLEKRRRGEDAGPLAGADVLPLVYSDDLNNTLLNGKQGNQDAFDHLGYQLLLTEQTVGELLGEDSPFDSLASVTTSAGINGNSLTLYSGPDDSALRWSGTVFVNNCLSSCYDGPPFPF